MSSRRKSTTKSAKTGQLQLVLKAGESIVTHKPFGSENENPNSGKIASDKVHATGFLMPKACTNCLGALRSYTDTHKYGRGMNKANEVFCCMAHKEHGNGGQQCGRCLGMNKGPGCVPPAAEAEPAACAVVAAAAEYNRILVANKDKEGKDFSAADKAAIQKAVDASAAFFRINAGLIKSNTVEATPIKKRKHAELETTTALTGLDSKLTTRHHSLEDKMNKLIADVGSLKRKLRAQSNEMADLKDTLAVARGRQVAISEGVNKLIDGMNELIGEKNTERRAR